MHAGNSIHNVVHSKRLITGLKTMETLDCPESGGMCARVIQVSYNVNKQFK